MTIDHDFICIRCSRVENLPQAPVPSRQQPCEVCGRDVWVSELTLSLVARHHPGEAIHVACMECPMDDEHEVVHLPEQVTDLRNQGISDMMIAATLATADVANGLSLTGAVDDMAANPLGDRAQAFPEAFERAATFVRSVPR